MDKICLFYHCCCKWEMSLYFQSRVWPLIGVGTSCVIVKHCSNTWGFYCNSFERDILAFFPSLWIAVYQLCPKENAIYSVMIICSLAQCVWCVKICPFMFISAIGSNFTKPSLYIHVFLWLYSWGNLFCLYYKGVHYNFSSSCNPNLPVLSQSIRTMLLTFEGCGDLKRWF